MLRLSATLLLATTLSSNNINYNEKLQTIESRFPLLWKTKVGNISFRSNIIFNKDKLIVPSNGERYMDYNLYDKSSGIYILNRKNGKVETRFGAECIGDMDVTGILEYNQKLYYGNDNDEFFCSTLQGKTIWRNPTSGDIEHEPVIINTKAQNEIVYATESGEVRAVNPDNGKTIWVYYTPDFNSWKPGDNRTVFKVKAYFSNTTSFFTKPELIDLNDDGVDDLVYLTYDSKIYSIDGKTGKLLWCYSNSSNSERFNMPYKINNQIVIPVYGFRYQNNTYEKIEIKLNKYGKVIEEKVETSDEGISLNYICTKQFGKIYGCRNTLYLIDDKGNQSKINTLFDGKRKSYFNDDSEVITRKYYDPILSNRIFDYQNEKNCVIVLSQRDMIDYDKGFIEIVSLDKKSVIERLSLPAISEMTPIISDVNQDGNLDLLINCSDGYLYCFSLNNK